jgi:hypothetical protein
MSDLRAMLEALADDWASARSLVWNDWGPDDYAAILRDLLAEPAADGVEVREVGGRDGA